MPYETPDAFNPATVLRLIQVSVDPRLLGAVDDAICGLADPSLWVKFGTLTVAQVTDYFNLRCLEYLSVSLVGMIFPYATTLPPNYALACDGTTYLKSAYPSLYAALAPAFIVDPTHFKTPDLRDRVVAGSGTSYTIGQNFGEATHLLTTGEMPAHTHISPAHTHVDSGHTHTESQAFPATIIPGELPVPLPSAIPAVGVTGVGFAAISSTVDTNNNTGGGASHENRQPSLGLGYCIVYA